MSSFDVEEMIADAAGAGSTTLALSGAGLTELPASIADLTHLQRLLVGANELTSLPDWIGQLTELTELSLGGNRLTSLPESVGHLVNLQRLAVDRNQLRHIPESIGELRLLTHLFLDSNRLSSLPESMSQLKQLYRLALDENQLEVLPDWLFKLTKVTELSFASVGLSELPAAIGQMSSLIQLHLDGNDLTALPETIGRLGSLTDLVADRNELVSLPESIGQLSRLTVLSAGGNRLTSLPESIGRLRNLTELSLYRNQLTALPESIGGLVNLGHLFLGGNQLTELPSSIGHLANLKRLLLDGNRLESLPDSIGQLADLRRLLIDGNDLKSLPTTIGQLTDLQDVKLDRNPLPVELLSVYSRQGIDGVKIWLNQQATGGVLSEAKVLVLGEGAVGKTSLIARLSGNGFVSRPQTHGIELGATEVAAPDGVPLTLRFWDFGGQEHFRPTQQFFFTPNTVYLVVWHGREGVERGDLLGHLERIRLRVGPGAHIILVATHCGPDVGADVDLEQMQRAAGGEIAGVARVDNETGEGIDALLTLIVRHASELEHMSVHWSAPSLRLAAFVATAAERHPQMSWADLLAKGDEFGLSPAEVENVAIRLSVLGRMTYFANRVTLAGRVILQPEWLTTAISYVLADAETRRSGGVIDHARLRDLWTDPPPSSDGGEPPRRFAREDFAFLVELMQHYAVSFQFLDGRSSLIGQLVPEQRAEELKIPSDVLARRVRRVVVSLGNRSPLPGLMAALITRNHGHQTGQWWRHGVVLRHSGHDAWALITLRDNSTLSITVWDDHGESFFYVLRGGIEAVLGEWRHLNPQWSVACPTRDDSHDPDRYCPGLWPYAHLERFSDEGDEGVRCGECGVRHPIEDLLGSVHRAPTTAARNAQIVARLDELVSGQRAMRDAVAKLRVDGGMYLRAILDHLATETVDVPRLATINLVDGKQLNPASWFSERFELRLWCEFPDGPHPTEPRYPFTQARDWYRRAGPYLRWVSLALRLTPLVGAALPVIGDQYSASAGVPDDLAEIRHAVALTEEIARLATTEVDAPTDPRDVPPHAHHAASNRPELRFLKQLVHDIGAWPELGLLTRTHPAPSSISTDAAVALTPDGRHYWLCAEHLRMYEQGPPVEPR